MADKFSSDTFLFWQAICLKTSQQFALLYVYGLIPSFDQVILEFSGEILEGVTDAKLCSYHIQRFAWHQQNISCQLWIDHGGKLFFSLFINELEMCTDVYWIENFLSSMNKVEKTWNQGCFALSLDEVAIEKNKRTNFTWDTNSGKLEEMNYICKCYAYRSQTKLIYQFRWARRNISVLM